MQAHPSAMTKGTRWTEREELAITRSCIGRTSTHLGDNMRGAVFYAGIHVNVLGTCTRHPAAMDDPQYWHARNVAAVRARWSDVIVPVCTKMRAGNRFVKSKPLTGMAKLYLQHQGIAEMNGIKAPDFQSDVPGW